MDANGFWCLPVLFNAKIQTINIANFIEKNVFYLGFAGMTINSHSKSRL